MSSDIQKFERVLIRGDLSQLSDAERLSYYNAVCQSVGLNPLTQPFEYLRLNGKEILYAKRACTDQLRQVNGVSVSIKARETIEGVYVVTAEAKDKSGRTDESTGAVSIKGLAGEALANAFMKAETKAKRRVTLSLCGLGMMDETEIETIPNAEPVRRPVVNAAKALPEPAAVQASSMTDDEKAAIALAEKVMDIFQRRGASESDSRRVLEVVVRKRGALTTDIVDEILDKCDKGAFDKSLKVPATQGAK